MEEYVQTGHAYTDAMLRKDMYVEDQEGSVESFEQKGLINCVSAKDMLI